MHTAGHEKEKENGLALHKALVTEGTAHDMHVADFCTGMKAYLPCESHADKV